MKKILLNALLISFYFSIEASAQSSSDYQDLIDNDKVTEQKQYSYYGFVLDYDKNKLELKQTIKINRKKNTIEIIQSSGHRSMRIYNKDWKIVEVHDFRDGICYSKGIAEYLPNGKISKSKSTNKELYDTLDFDRPSRIVNYYYDDAERVTEMISIQKRRLHKKYVNTKYTKLIAVYDRDGLRRAAESYESKGDSLNYKYKRTQYFHYNEAKQKIHQFYLGAKNILPTEQKFYYTEDGNLRRLEDYDSKGKLMGAKEYRYQDGLLVERVYISAGANFTFSTTRYEYKFGY